MRKRISSLLVLLVLCCMVLMGCTKEFSLTYNIVTGDSVKVVLTLESGQDYKLKNNGSSFIIADKDDKTLLTGMFYTTEQYESLIEGFNQYGIESSGVVGIFDVYEFVNGQGENEYDYTYAVSGTGVYVIMYSNEDYSDAVKAVSCSKV